MMIKIFKLELVLARNMKFCPDCGTILALTRVNKTSEKTSPKIKCPKCGYTDSSSLETQPTASSKPAKSNETIVIISKEDQKFRTTPTKRVECPKCKNRLAEVWQVQTRSGDEGATQFFRCTQCNHTWRLYT
jgi:DNA-directed RNA polymerase subunit M